MTFGWILSGYFVDQDEQGAARFNPIEISPQGNILNWPDSFFDETMLQEDRITAAGLKKRAEKVREIGNKIDGGKTAPLPLLIVPTK